MTRQCIKNIPLKQLTEQVKAMEEPEFRARQIIKWVYQKRVDSFNAMTTLSKSLREKLGEVYSCEKLPVRSVLVSKYGDAVKFAVGLRNTRHVAECVLLVDGKRRTACLSSQLGCGLGCVFCATGTMGFLRNLTLDEIIGQLIAINDYLGARDDKLVTNIVFMGMGEALSNFDTFRDALDIIMHEDTFNIGGRRITVSTAGVIPSVERLMTLDLNIGLAISLNAWSDEERSRIMPVNRTYPIASLVDIAKRYYEKTGRRVTFEYVLIAGKTDTADGVNALVDMLGGFPCKINLIPLNVYGQAELRRTPEKTLLWFADELHRRGIAATVRKSRGQDISGACGQLAGRDDVCPSLSASS